VIPDRHQVPFRLRGRAATLALTTLGLGLALGWTPSAPDAATAPGRIKLDNDDLKRPIVLDQNGQWVRSQGAAGGSAPTYVGFPVDRNTSTLSGFTSINTGPRVAGQTVGPLHLTADTRGRLDAALAQDGQALVQTANQTLLVKPAGAFTSADGQSRASAWLSAQAAAQSATPPPSTTPRPQSLVQMLKLDKLGQSISDSKLIKDLGHLLTVRSGKLVNWNQQSLNTLKRDLKLAPPKAENAGRLGGGVGATARPRPGSGPAAAQELGGPAAGGTVLAAPVPEPGTYLIFGLGAGALLLRRRLGRVRPTT
jgi:hypothetical protein